ncbi:hypothetical protein [Agromyces arachidis]|uniref:hypothetical protein n=1 Tax=Agromyces arachidis TaxID=766966 RepID=UPI004057B24B
MRTISRDVTAAAALLTVVAALLSGCAAEEPGPTAGPTAGPSATTPSPTPSAAPETTAPATEEPPAARGPGAPLEAVDAYALCRAQTLMYHPGDPTRVEYAPFEEATVLLRDDGDWFVYMDVDDGNREPELVEVGGVECIVGGTIGEPDWQRFGAITRDIADEAIANYNEPEAGA